MEFDYAPEEINTQDRIEFLLWMSTHPGQFGRRGMPHPGFQEWLAAHDAVLIDYIQSVLKDPKYGHDREWVGLNLHPDHLRRIARGEI